MKIIHFFFYSQKGIICGSEPDQASILCIRRSHESLDSGEIDQEEESIEILDTTSMNEEYRLLQSDLCFYQTPEKYNIKTKNIINDIGYKKSSRDDGIKYQDSGIHTICVSIDIENNDATNDTNSSKSIVENNVVKESGKSNLKLIETTTASSSSPTPSPVPATTEAKPETIKNEVIFKSIFGATKNAIFRTAQSIIDNHEKKFSSKNKIDGSGAISPSSEPNAAIIADQIKSPTEISKKKEFFTLKPCLIKSNKTQSISVATTSSASTSPTTPIGPSTVTSTSTTTDTIILPDNDHPTKFLSKLSIAAAAGYGKDNNSKIKVPGGVRCLTSKSKSIELPIKSEKGHSGLLRFFESPIFNIHFALHYLFYSKEPGVLSFIGNKIFNFKDCDVDLYMPQLILMYIQMDELAEVLDPYLVYRCRRNADFSLKCCWLLEAYNHNVDTFNSGSNSNSTANNGKGHLSLMKELYPKRERRQLQRTITPTEIPFKDDSVFSPIKKTHHR